MSDDNTLIGSEIDYIDPLHCGSTVGYTITRYKPDYGDKKIRVDGQVEIADCNRKVTWSFDRAHDDDILKIERAIEILTQFKREFIKARRAANKENAKAKNGDKKSTA